MIDPPLHIALISEHASPLAAAGGVDAGGQNIYVDRVARGLAAKGHTVDVLTRRDQPDLPTLVDVQRGVRVLHIDAGPPEPLPKEDLLPFMPAFAAAAGTLIKRGRGYDVQHANFFMSGWVGLALRRRFGIPLVVTFHALGLVRQRHQGGADRFPKVRIPIEHQLAGGADAVIATCPQDEQDLLELYGADPAHVHVVPCGVDIDQFRAGGRARARARLRIDPSEFVVLQLGRMVPRKGVDNVVRALAQLDGPPRARLYIVGGATREPDLHATPELERLRSIAEAHGVADRVVFVGRRDQSELRDWYQAADVFATTPWYEPFGITPLEAMACGRPVVASAVGGLKTTVLDGVTGFLVPPNDATALARRLDQLRRQPSLASALGRAGAQRVRRHFTWSDVTAQLAQVYAQVAVPESVSPPAWHAPVHASGSALGVQ